MGREGLVELAMKSRRGKPKMSRATRRYAAQRGLELLDRLDTHCAPRRPSDARTLVEAIDDLRKLLLRLADAAINPDAN